MTLVNRSKTGRMAKLESMQWKYKTGLMTVGDRSSKGSIIIQKPAERERVIFSAEIFCRHDSKINGASTASSGRLE